jgi:hypothetical protein
VKGLAVRAFLALILDAAREDIRIRQPADRCPSTDPSGPLN